MENNENKNLESVNDTDTKEEIEELTNEENLSDTVKEEDVTEDNFDRNNNKEVASETVLVEKKEKLKKKKSNVVPIVLGTCGLSLLCGLGGGYVAYKSFDDSGVSKINYSSTESTSKTTTVSSKSGLTVSEAANKAIDSVVEIKTESTGISYGLFGGTYTSEASGSGVIISSDGYIVTNNHVVENSNSIKVTTNEGTEYDATLVGTDETSDVAVLKIEASGLSAATIGNSDNISVGDTAIVIGNPLGTLGGTVTDGIISSTSREMTINGEPMELIQTNAEINSGNSGGGLFDGNGNLIGIVNAKDSGTTSSGTTIEGIGFAIPVNTVMEVAEELMNYGEVTNRATLGVQTQDVSSEYGQYKEGVYIVGIQKNSAAESAGLKEYDRIISVDGKEVTTSTELKKEITSKSVGDSVKIVVERDGEEIEITATLGGSSTIEEA